MLCAEKQSIVSESITRLLILSEQGVLCSHSIEQALCIDEWQQGNTLPSKLLAVEIYHKVFGVEVLNVGVFVSHERVEDGWQNVITAGWHDTHELFVRSERFALLEIEVHFLEINKVSCERSVVMRIVPGPTGTSLEVVEQDPGQTLDVVTADLVAEVNVACWDVELLLVVTVGITRLPEHDGILSRSIRILGRAILGRVRRVAAWSAGIIVFFILALAENRSRRSLC